MGHFRIMGSSKDKFDEEGMKAHILYNLKRLYAIDKFPENNTVESGVLGKMNEKLCGIDKSGRGKLFKGSRDMLKDVWDDDDEFGCEECKRRNYLVVMYGIRGIYGHFDRGDLMPYDDFKLYCAYGTVLWGNGDDKKDWTTFNSVDIIYEILKIMNKKKLVKALRGDVDEETWRVR